MVYIKKTHESTELIDVYNCTDEYEWCEDRYGKKPQVGGDSGTCYCENTLELRKVDIRFVSCDTGLKNYMAFEDLISYSRKKADKRIVFEIFIREVK